MLGSFLKPFYYIIFCLIILVLIISCFFTPIISEEILVDYDLNAIENMQISSSRFRMASARIHKNKFIFWKKSITNCRGIKLSQRDRYRSPRGKQVNSSSRWNNNIYGFSRRWRLHNNTVKRQYENNLLPCITNLHSRNRR